MGTQLKVGSFHFPIIKYTHQSSRPHISFFSLLNSIYKASPSSLHLRFASPNSLIAPPTPFTTSIFMEKIDQETRETHDFMNVESFSQLPFIRPTPSIKEKGIRLFGKEFVADSRDNNNDDNNNTSNRSENIKENNENGEMNKPKFECHYCCRHFPTSQALGGHQNAHKRERQNAKRGHLQIPHGGYPEAHVYGFMNYHHRLGSAPPTHPTPVVTTTFQPWNHHSTKFHGGANGGGYTYPQATPINGSPLWRITQGHSVSSPVHHVPMFFPSGELKPSMATNNHISSIASSQNFVPKIESRSANTQDQVSLDLCL